MAHGSGIEWTESTWNPVTGCTKISPGCKHCYAERMADRLQAMGQPNYATGSRSRCNRTCWSCRCSWKKPQAIFVNSMSDLFHEDVPLEYIQQRLRRHAPRALASLPGADEARGAPAGARPAARLAAERLDGRERRDSPTTSTASTRCDGPRRVVKIPLAGAAPAGRFRSLDLDGIDWVIVGGESGPGARPMDPEWVTDIRDQCRRAAVAFFFKQWGGRNKKKNGRLLEGRTWDEMPVIGSTPGSSTPRDLPRAARP